MVDRLQRREVGGVLGVSRQRVYQMQSENRHFPPPLMRLASGPLWLRSTIEEFDRTWPRKPGRPKRGHVLLFDPDEIDESSVGRITAASRTDATTHESRPTKA